MKTILSKIILILPAIVLQLLYFIIIYILFEPLFPIFSLIFLILSFLFILYIISTRGESSYKMLWMILLLTVPILVAWLYLSFGNKNTSGPILKKINKENKNINYDSNIDKNIIDEIKKKMC